MKSLFWSASLLAALFLVVLFFSKNYYQNKEDIKLAKYLPVLLKEAEEFTLVSDSARILSNKIAGYCNASRNDFKRLKIAKQSRLDSCFMHLAMVRAAWELKEGQLFSATQTVRFYKFPPKEILKLAKIDISQIREFLIETDYLSEDERGLIEKTWSVI